MLGLCREPEAIIQANLVYQLAHKYRRPGHRLYLGARLAEKSGFPDRKEQTVTIWLDLSLKSVPPAGKSPQQTVLFSLTRSQSPETPGAECSR